MLKMREVFLPLKDLDYALILLSDSNGRIQRFVSGDVLRPPNV